MATFVLVPGAWSGGWAWQKVAPNLRAAGHEVYTPTPTGLGERVHLAHPGIDLDTHITDVVNALDYEDLRDVVLVGWSYGGMVITGVADKVPERLAQLVYLDAQVPEDGQSGYDVHEFSETDRADERQRAEAAGTPGFMPTPGEDLQDLVPDEADFRWMLARMVPHPLATLAQPVRLRNPAVMRLPRAYILCTDDLDPGALETPAVARARVDPNWRVRELAANHFALVTAPRETAAALLDLM